MTALDASVLTESHERAPWLHQIAAAGIAVQVVSGVPRDAATSPASLCCVLPGEQGHGVIYVPAGDVLLTEGVRSLVRALREPGVVLAVGAATWPDGQGSAHLSQPARRLGIPLPGESRRVSGQRMADAIASYASAPTTTPSAVAIRRSALDRCAAGFRWPDLAAPDHLADRMVPLWLAVLSQGDAVVLRDPVTALKRCPDPPRTALGERVNIQWWLDVIERSPRLSPVERRRAMSTLMRRISHLPLPDVDDATAEGARLAMHALAARVRRELPLAEILPGHDAAPYVQAFLAHPSVLDPDRAAELAATWREAFGDRDDVELVVPAAMAASVEALTRAGIRFAMLPDASITAIGSPIVALGPRPTVDGLRRFAPSLPEALRR